MPFFNMTCKEAAIVTDEEIYEELEKLGYSNVSPKVFQEMKEEIVSLIASKKSHKENYQSNVVAARLKSRLMNRDFHPLHDISPNISASLLNWKSRTCSKIYNSGQVSDSVSDSAQNSSVNNFSLQKNKYFDCELSRYPNLQKYGDKWRRAAPSDGGVYRYVSPDSRRRPLSTVDELKPTDIRPTYEENQTNDAVDTNFSFDKYSSYKSRWRNYKTASERKREDLSSNSPDAMNDLESSLHSMDIDGKLKRKVLRHKNGNPTLTEEMVDIPSIFSSSYPETSRNSEKSHASNSVSWKSNSSTESLAASSPKPSPRSMFSPSRKLRTSKQFLKKKSDPVAMYNYYRKFWDSHKPPGEKSHDKLRWAVRDKMLDYTL